MQNTAQESLLESNESKERKISKIQWGCIGFVILLNIGVALSYGLVITEINKGVIDASKICSASDPGAHRYRNPSSQEVNNYFYNITNPMEIIDGGQAILHEIGPFAYKFKNHRGNVKYDSKEDTVSSDDWYV